MLTAIDYTSVIAGSTSAYVAGATSSISAGQIDITATDTSMATPDITQVNVGIITVGVINATPTITRTTAAYVGQDVVLQAGSGALNLIADSTSIITSGITGFSLSLVVSIDVLTQGGTITNNTFAYIDENATVAAGDIVVKADSESRLTSVVDGVSISLGTIGAMTVVNTINGATEAYVEEKAKITAASLQVDAIAINEATSDLLYVGVGLVFAGADAQSTATITSNVNAFIGPRAAANDPVSVLPDIDVGDEIFVRAVSTDTAFAELRGGTGSAIAAGNTLKPTATIGGAVHAYVGENANIAGGSLTVATEIPGRATMRMATAKVTSGAVAILGAGTNSGATASIDGGTSASVSDGAKIATMGKTAIRAVTTAKANANAKGGAGALGVAVALFKARSTIAADAGAQAWIGDAADISGDSVTVEADGTYNAVAGFLSVSIAPTAPKWRTPICGNWSKVRAPSNSC